MVVVVGMREMAMAAAVVSSRERLGSRAKTDRTKRELQRRSAIFLSEKEGRI